MAHTRPCTICNSRVNQKTKARKMNEYFANFHRQLIIYKQRFGKNYAKISWHTMMYLFRNWFGGQYKFRRYGDIVNIGFLANGGFGDIVLFGAYLDKFIKKLDCPYKIHVFTQQSITSVKTLFTAYKTNTEIHSRRDLRKTPLDLLISFNFQFPEIYFYRQKYIEQKSKFLPSYIDATNKFITKYSYLFEPHQIFNQQILLDIIGLNRITGMDPTQILGLTPDDKMNTLPPSDSADILKKFGLESGKFITFSYDFDVLNNSKTSIRLWPQDNLQTLIKLLKAHYPEYKIVQLGITSIADFTDIDLNLVNKTSFTEFLAILSTSKLHFDSECGMVHLRHAICGEKSVVLHGPTSISTKGYSENINICSNVCKCACCEWLIGGAWQEHCAKSDSPIPACMQSILPQDVFEKISGVL